MQVVKIQQIDRAESYDSKLTLISPHLLKFCKSRIYNEQDAEDVCQKSIYILIEKNKEYNKNKSFWSWAWKITRFQIMAYLTRRKRNREDVSGDSFLHSLEKTDQKMPFSDVLKLELKKERDDLVKKAFKTLSLKQQHFLSLSMSGKSKNFIMRHMNITNVNYYSLKRRMLKKLKQQINT
jgi:RNA polymerase sigma factor (sigma-70 family)